MKRKGKSIIAFLLTLVMIFGWMPTVGWITPENNDLLSVQAAEADSGTWGTCPWNLDADGTLTIGGGTGENLKYSSQYAGRSYVAPWCAHVKRFRRLWLAHKEKVELWFYRKAQNKYSNTIRKQQP